MRHGFLLCTIVVNRLPVFGFSEKSIFMPYAINDGTRIHYEMVGDGPPLVLQHGFSGSGRDWLEFGYVEAMQEHIASS
jgi:hypothetical protein